jgi:5'-phosphate synthase pdxT subunit
MSTIGVLALQGNFDAHAKAVERAGGTAIEVRTAAQMESCDGLILPGGESTTMLRLLDVENLVEPLRRFGLVKPIYGTCAGAILLAREVTNPAQMCLKLMDTVVERNAYGRQLDSRIIRLKAGGGEIEAVFIRAPIIRRTGKGKILASYQGDPVWVEQGLHMVTTFHPELTTDTRVHKYFLNKVAGEPAIPEIPVPERMPFAEMPPQSYRVAADRAANGR